MMETKICTKCGRELPLSEFYSHKGKKDGHASQCRDCSRKGYHDRKYTPSDATLSQVGINVYCNNIFGTMRVAENDGKPLFCLSDICKALHLSNVSAVTRRLAEKGVTGIKIETAGGPQTFTFIDEPNLYRCIMNSNKPEAEKFQDWVTDEVLPSIRKTGKYEIKQPIVDASDFDRSIQMAELLLATMKKASETAKVAEQATIEAKRANERIDKMEKEREVNGILLLDFPDDDCNPMPNETTRDKCRELVNIISKAKNIKQDDVWHKVYDRLYYVYHVSVNSIKKINKRESNLAALERKGHLSKVFDVLCSIKDNN